MLLSYDLDFDFMTLIHDRNLDAMKMYRYLPTKMTLNHVHLLTPLPKMKPVGQRIQQLGPE